MNGVFYCFTVEKQVDKKKAVVGDFKVEDVSKHFNDIRVGKSVNMKTGVLLKEKEVHDNLTKTIQKALDSGEEVTLNIK